MNADRRVVPSHHVTSVLAEESLSERTLEVKQTLKQSPNKVHNVADKWLLHDGINPLARVIIQNVAHVPRTAPVRKIHTTVHHREELTHHDNNHINKTHGHEAHGGHWHDAHGHGHEAHGGHGHTGGLASFVSTWHWFGDHGAFIFGMIGRGLGEFIGYTLKLLAVLMIFGPTRTAIITMIVIILLNIYAGTSLSVWLGAGALLVIHGIFSMIGHYSGWGGHESHGGGWHSHDDHGHGGGHWEDHWHGHH